MRTVNKYSSQKHIKDLPGGLVCGLIFCLSFLFVAIGCGETDLGGGIQIDSTGPGGGGGPVTPEVEVTATPLVVSTTPASPAISIDPVVNGTAEVGAAVTIYSDSGCTTTVGTGTADGAGNFSVSLDQSMEGGTSLNFYAQALASGKSLSACSTTTTSFTSHSIRPGLAFLTGTQTNAGASPTQVNQAAAQAIEWSSSEFDARYYSHDTTTNSHIVTIEQAGDYLVSATLPLTMTAGNMRPVTRMEVRLNGALYQGAVGESTYIRFDGTTGNSESSGHVALILRNLNPTDTIEVYTIETAGEDGSEVVSITSVASLYLEFVEASRSIFTATATRTVAGTDINGASSEFQWTQDRISGDFTHDDVTDSHEITLSAGFHMIYVNVPITASSQRVSPKVLVRLNGATVNGGQASQGYMRNDSGHNESSVHWSGFVQASGGDVLTVTSEQEGGGGTVNVQGGAPATITVERLSATDGVIALRGNDLDTGTDWNAAGTSEVLWNLSDVVDATDYVHDPLGASPNEIQVSAQGDYLLVYNDSMSGSDDRVSPIIKIQVNGVDVPGAETKTHYIRNDNGHNESSASLVFLLRNLSANDVVTVTAQRDLATQTVNDVEDALLCLIKK